MLRNEGKCWTSFYKYAKKTVNVIREILLQSRMTVDE
jgi:hypothetical protein